MRLDRLAASTVVVLLCVLAVPSSIFATNLQSQLDVLYDGSWAVLLVETASSCDASYTNNRVTGGRAHSSAPHRLPPGELGRIAKIDVRRSRIDLLVDIEEPLRLSWRDGPFDLFEQARCRVELQVEVPREWVKRQRVDEVERHLADLLERHDTRATALHSELWNRREVAPLPAGYEQVLRERRAWKLGQLQGELASILGEALRVVDRADDEPAYGAGLAAGLEREKRRYRSWDACEEVADTRFYADHEDAPSELGGSEKRDWERGYRDGQLLAFQVALARRISECFRDL